MKKIYIALLLSFMIATPALADNTGKAYIAADVGRAIFVPAIIYDNPAMVRIAGGYHFSPMFAAEIGYTKFSDLTAAVTGGTSSGTISISTSSLQAVAVARLPLNSKFDLTAKLGMSNNAISAKATGNITLINSNLSTTSLMYGVGAQYHLNPQFSVRAQYEDYGALPDSSPTIKLTAFSAGVVYNF